jgi:hypothetical protein
LIESYHYDTENGKYQFLLEALSSGNQRVISVSYCSNSRLFDSAVPVPQLMTDLLQASTAIGASTGAINAVPNALTDAEKQALQGVLMGFVPVPVLAGHHSSTCSLKAGLAEIRETTTMFMKVA